MDDSKSQDLDISFHLFYFSADLRGQTGGGGQQLGGGGQPLGGGGQIASTPRQQAPSEPYVTPRGPDGEPTHARGGHGIFGAPKVHLFIECFFVFFYIFSLNVNPFAAE